ncbi:MAG: Na(+)/H(+) antiporter subunit D [Candidatus Aminicenantes bacterium]|nr:Na(+)/H(+) antiporter subunit D [Candidatus Aminicenantes bacterium]
MTPAGLFFPPGLVAIAGAVLVPLLPRRARSAAFLAVCLLALALVFAIPDGASRTVRVMDYSLVLLRMDALSRVFGIVFALIALAGGIYAFHLKDSGQQTAALLYAGSGLGVVLAGDLLTLLVFWEVMALASTYLVWARRTEESEAAGTRYLLVHVFGGGLLFTGILVHLSQGGALEISAFAPGTTALGPWLMLAGILLNAACPPLHAWLPDAYPRATVTGAVFMSAFTTKAAVYLLLRVYPGWKILLVLGVMMTLYGVAYAILADDIRGILSYHIVSQVGFMVAGAGIGSELAVNGSAAHAYSHILYKALLFMACGAVLEATGRSKLSELGGLAKAMPRTLALYMIAAFSISGVPLFNGFVSKSMVLAAAHESHLTSAWALMMLASAGTFFSVGLKLPYYAWFAKPHGAAPKPIPRNMEFGMGLVAILCVGYGVAPGLLYRFLPHAAGYEPFTAAHLVETGILLGLTFLAFWLVKGLLKPHEKSLFDLDWLYRKPAGVVRRVFVDGLGSLFDRSERRIQRIVRGAAAFGRNPAAALLREKPAPAYAPDRYRPLTQLLVLLVLSCFLVLALLGLIW